MKINLLLLISLLIKFTSTGQYQLSDKQIQKGFQFLIENAGFRNPRSVEVNKVNKSNYRYQKECFTWARYDVSGKNGFGGYVRNEFDVWFFNGDPFHLQNTDEWKPMTTPDGGLDWIILQKYGDKDYLKCPGETERIEKEKLQKRESDKKKYAIIETLINQKKFDEARNQIISLNFQSEFPRLNEFNMLYDEHIISKIKSNLDSNNFNEAAVLYEILKIKSNRELIVKDIQTKLDDHFKNLIDSIPSDKYTKYINNNHTVFKVLKPGRYNLKIDRDGKVYLNGNSIGANAEVAEKRFGSWFNVKIVSEAWLNISEVFIPQGDKKYLVSTQKPIISKPNGKKYFGGFGGPGSIATMSGHIKLNTTYDQTIPKNTLRTVQPSLKKIKINNSVEIPLEVQNVMIQEEKVKVRAGVIIFRALGIAATSAGVFVAYLALL